MKNAFHYLCMAVCFLGISTSYASIDVYEFETEQQEREFSILEQELRCPKCQNQNIADSNAGLAKDIKDRAYKLLKEGKSREEITEYMVERYGDFITYRPPVTRSTWVLWFGPFVLLVVVLAILMALFRRRKGAGNTAEKTGIVSDAERSRAEALLQQYGQDQSNSEEK